MDGVYERLTLKQQYTAGEHFAHVVETRSGMVAVANNGTIYGGGIYDGVVNTDLRHDELNGIHRAYMIGAVHPSARRVLFIGLGSGAWANVLADHPDVESLTVLEINPAYVTMLGFYPNVAALTKKPNVHIEIDDGRRWLSHHPEARFDLIISSTTFNWRSNATSLLSTEFLDLVRQRLNPGGVLLINSTGSGRVQLTVARAFPYVWRISGLMAASESPIALDFARARAQMANYRVDGRLALNMSAPEDRVILDDVLRAATSDVEPRASVLSRLGHLTPITEDNMGTEWFLSRYLRPER
jgi:spermidine synthase